MIRRVALMLALAVLVPSALIPAAAVAAAPSKATVLARWTQPTAASTSAWNAARLDREPWASYGFIWSTDYCSFAPEKPLGFDFTVACWHHDFGYRNYQALHTFKANKARVDDTFHADLQRVCATYRVVVRPACYSLAWTYYQAVHVFGSLYSIRAADVDRSRALLP